MEANRSRFSKVKGNYVGFPVVLNVVTFLEEGTPFETDVSQSS